MSAGPFMEVPILTAEHNIFVKKFTGFGGLIAWKMVLSQ